MEGQLVQLLQQAEPFMRGISISKNTRSGRSVCIAAKPSSGVVQTANIATCGQCLWSCRANKRTLSISSSISTAFTVVKCDSRFEWFVKNFIFIVNVL